MSRIRQLLIMSAVFLLVSACAGTPPVEPESPVFQHEFTGAQLPWTNDQFDNAEDKFTFAVFSDLNGGEREGVFEVAVEQLRLFLVLDTEDNTPEFQDYMYQIRNQAIQIFATEGNQAFLDSEYGQLQERNSGRIGSGQAEYFRSVIAAHPEVRWTFLFMHKPAWERSNEENFSTIESALSERPYTVFHGHVHSYLYQQRLGRDYIRLGTTGGSHAPGDPMAIDHVTLVTVADEGVDVANLRMSGIFDKTGKLPLNGDELCLQSCSD